MILNTARPGRVLRNLPVSAGPACTTLQIDGVTCEREDIALIILSKPPAAAVRAPDPSTGGEIAKLTYSYCIYDCINEAGLLYAPDYNVPSGIKYTMVTEISLTKSAAADTLFVACTCDISPSYAKPENTAVEEGVVATIWLK